MNAASNSDIKREVFNRFYQKVKAMREAQNRYFDRRTSENLTASKFIEREVDVLIRDIGSGAAFRQQITLDLGPTA